MSASSACSRWKANRSTLAFDRHAHPPTGASGVTGAGFITLAATLQVVQSIPIESLAIIVGIDKFMSECRALTNLIGNGVATVVVSRWEGELDRDKLNAALDRPVTLGEETRREAA